MTLQTGGGSGENSPIKKKNKNITKCNKAKFSTADIAKPHYCISQFCLVYHINQP